MNAPSAVCCHATSPQCDRKTSPHSAALLKVLSSQVHEGCVVACAMTRRLGPIFNAANDAVEQALSTTSRAELVRGGGYISPKCSRHGHVQSQGVTTMGRLANKHILQGPVLIFG